jgi:hypothetical protein
VTGFLGPGPCTLRLRTNLQVYWDQVYLARQGGALPRVSSRPVASAATLRHRGFAQEVDVAGTVAYDDNRLELVATTRWRGRLTRLGDVAELVKARDDRFVLCGPGDEVEIAFDAAGLPPPGPGQVRSFVLRCWGYCKDTAPTTRTGGHTHPLPRTGMVDFPPPGPADGAQRRYDREWNTRLAGESTDG